MPTVRLARMAMATRWELVLQGDDAAWLRAAGEEALDEISRLDAHLSIYRPRSAVSRVNAHAADGPVPVEPRLFRLLQTARRLYDATDGAFDVTVGPLMAAWDFVHRTGRLPDPDALAAARAVVGMPLVHLDEAARTVRFERPGVRIDLGGIGKGHAVDEAVAILREKGVAHAFLHGGTSAVYALGRPTDADAWKVAVEYPGTDGAAGEDDVLAVVPLLDEALSVSAVWGKAFVVDGRTYGHVLDPRTGRPVQGALLAAVAGASATEADALSTALLALGRAGADLARPPDRRALLLLPTDTDDRYVATTRAMPVRPSPRLVA